MRFSLINVFFKCWLGKKSADSQLAGNFPGNVAGKWNFSYHPAGSAEQIFFSQQQEKNTKNAFKVFTYHCDGLNIAFWENVSLGAPGSTPRSYHLQRNGEQQALASLVGVRDFSQFAAQYLILSGLLWIGWTPY